MSSATDAIRAMLDERGVEYMLDQRHRELFWDFGESGRARASAIGTKGLVQMIVTGLTPEQAIAATLGAGTCRNESEYPQMFFYCSECGCAHKRNRAYVDMPRFCPNCGRKVISE